MVFVQNGRKRGKRISGHHFDSCPYHFWTALFYFFSNPFQCTSSPSSAGILLLPSSFTSLLQAAGIARSLVLQAKFWIYEFCCEASDLDGKILVVAGLDGDYLSRSFGSVFDVIPLADPITKVDSKVRLDKLWESAMEALKILDGGTGEVCSSVNVVIAISVKY
ncbi:Thymidine kinase [Abeliophyllum distichum]|uniref:Thymidine kinase n=1 Tax=Abeliophyllum distichum TaxID=126358 RepID=A0ABD1V3L2_9LAMI